MIERAIIEENGMGRMEPEMRAAQRELVRRGVPVTTFLRKHMERRRVAIDRATLVVATVPMMELALRKLGVEVPPDPSYPDALRPFLLRRVWPSTMREVRDALEQGGEPRFVKPRERLKRFTGRVVERELGPLHAVSASTDVWCAEVVSFVSEHRAFVIDGRIVGLRCYAGDTSIAPDVGVMERVIEVWSASGATSAYGIDFGVLSDGRTALVELNEGYSLGAYGLDDALYVELLVRRWSELVAGASHGEA